MSTSTRTYALFEDFDGEPTSHWRTKDGEARVPGVRESTHPASAGQLFPPLPRWTVVAKSVKQAHWAVHNSHTSRDGRSAEVGIWHDRQRHDGPAPLGADLEQFWALIAECRARTITLWKSREEAENARRRLDEYGCGGRCWEEHRIERLTRDEVEKLKPVWASRRAP